MGNSAAEVLAQNLSRLMKEDRYRERLGTQDKLGTVAGVDQKTVSNCLKPGQRQPSAKGKTPSPTLANVEKIAAAFGLQVWELLMPEQHMAPEPQPAPEEVPV